MNLLNRDIIFPEVINCFVQEGTVNIELQEGDPINNLIPTITVNFSVSMDKESVNNSISLKRGNIENTLIHESWSHDNKSITITPVTALIKDNPYVFEISNNARSESNINLINNFIRKFFIINDKIKPFVTGSEPSLDGLKIVPKSQTVIVFFSEAMNAASVGATGTDGTSGAFAIYDKNNVKVAGSISWTENTNNIIFQPLKELNAFEIYKIEVTTEAKDLADNYLESVYNVYFTAAGSYILLRTITISNPLSLGFNSFFDIYAGGSSDDKIFKYESNGTKILDWDITSDACRGIAVDANGDIYISATDENRITKYDPNGYMYGWFGKGDTTIGWHLWSSEELPLSGSGDGEFNDPRGIAVDPIGNIYVVDSGNNRIQKFNSSCQLITAWGVAGSGDGEFSSPTGIEYYARDNSILITDSGNNRIQKFSDTGTFQSQFGSAGTGISEFNNPSGIAADTAGNIFVVDSGNCRIQRFDSNFNFITAWGSQGTDDNDLNNPFDIIIDNDGYIYVSDTDNNSIKVFGSF